MSDKHNIHIKSPTSDGTKKLFTGQKKHFSRALTTDIILKTYIVFLKSSGLISKKKIQDNLRNKIHSIDFLSQEYLQKIRSDLIRNNCSISDWGFFFSFWIKDKKDIGLYFIPSKTYLNVHDVSYDIFSRVEIFIFAAKRVLNDVTMDRDDYPLRLSRFAKALNPTFILEAINSTHPALPNEINLADTEREFLSILLSTKPIPQGAINLDGEFNLYSFDGSRNLHRYLEDLEEEDKEEDNEKNSDKYYNSNDKNSENSATHKISELISKNDVFIGDPQKADMILNEKNREKENFFDTNTYENLNPTFIESSYFHKLDIPASQKSNFDRMSPTQRERAYRDFEAARIQGKIEVPMGGGRCDILTESEIIEVKTWENWRHALGQVLPYGFHVPNRSKRIHLFGTPSDEGLSEIVTVCRKFSVSVTVCVQKN